MQLAHSGDERLTGLRVRGDAEGGILGGELLEGAAQPLLVDLGLRLDGDRDDGVGELHALEHDRMALVAERVPRRRVAQPDPGGDVARVDVLDLLALVGVHLEEPSDALLLALDGVVDVGARAHDAGIDPEERERPDVGIAHDLEGERREGLRVARQALLLVPFVGIAPLDGWDVERRRQVVDHRVEERLDTLVLEGAPAHDRYDLHAQRPGTDRGADLGLRDRLAVQVLLHEPLVDVRERLDEALAARPSRFEMIFGNVLLAVARAEALVLPHDRLHRDEVDHPPEVVLRAERELQHDRVPPQPLADLPNDPVEISTHPVHLVDEGHTRDAVAVRLSPDRLRLRLHTPDAAEHGHRAVQHPEAPLHLDREVDVARSIDDVHPVVAPEARGRRRRDGDAALLFLHHPVHHRGPLMDFTDLVADAGVVEDPLGGRRLPRIDVRHDADVAGAFERDGAWHGYEPAGAEALPAVVGESLVGLRHAVGVLLLLHGAAAAVGRVEDLPGEPLDHRLLRTGAGVLYHPAHGERPAPLRPDLDGHLVGGTPDAPRTHLDQGLHLLERTLEDADGILLGAFTHQIERTIEDTLGKALLAVVHHRVHELRHRPILVLRIGQHLSPLDLAFTWHGYGTLRLWPDGDLPSRRTPFVHFGLFAPYFERP